MAANGYKVEVRGKCLCIGHLKDHPEARVSVHINKKSTGAGASTHQIHCYIKNENNGGVSALLGGKAFELDDDIKPYVDNFAGPWRWDDLSVQNRVERRAKLLTVLNGVINGDLPSFVRVPVQDGRDDDQLVIKDLEVGASELVELREERDREPTPKTPTSGTKRSPAGTGKVGSWGSGGTVEVIEGVQGEDISSANQITSTNDETSTVVTKSTSGGTEQSGSSISEEAAGEILGVQGTDEDKAEKSRSERSPKEETHHGKLKQDWLEKRKARFEEWRQLGHSTEFIGGPH